MRRWCLGQGCPRLAMPVVPPSAQARRWSASLSREGLLQPGRAFAVAEPEPLALGLREPVAGPSDLQRRPVAGVGQDPVERAGAVGDQPAGHGRRDRPVPVQHRRFIAGAQQRHHRDGDQDLRPRRRHTPGHTHAQTGPAAGHFARNPARNSGPAAGHFARNTARNSVPAVRRSAGISVAVGGAAGQEPGRGDVGAELGQRSGPRPGPAGHGRRRWSVPRSPRRCRPGGTR